MKSNALSLALALCLGTPLACIAQAAPSAAATVHVADVARAQANAAKLASDAARLASERAAVEAKQARHLVPVNEDAEPVCDAEALAIAALRGLMAAPPERALPLVRKVLDGQQTARVKERAVFVLAQIDGAEATALLKQTAQSGQGKVRLQAVRALGIRGGADSLATLKALYPNGDDAIRAAVIESLMIANDRKGLYEIVRQARDENEARRGAEMLAAIGAVEELRALGADTRWQGTLIDAFIATEDVEALVNIVRGNGAQDLRVRAAHSLGMIGGAKASETLQSLYRETTDDALRSAIVEGLMIGGDDKALLAMYRAETKPERKRQLLETLSMMNSDAAFEAIDSALDGRSP
jgi:hypothetical protein